MDKPNFRTPDEIKAEMTDPKVPLSTRVPKAVSDRLEKAAQKAGISLSLLAADALLAYDSWLNSKKK